MAHSVKSLAKRWDCSRKTVYNLIDAGNLRAFSIGPRGTRITDEEIERWEGLQNTVAETLASDVRADIGLQTGAIRALASVRG